MNTRTVSAETFVKDCNEDKDLSVYRGAQIQGRVRLAGVRLSQHAHLERITFEGPVDFADAVFEKSFRLQQCTFRQALSFSDAQVGGELRLEDVAVLFQPSAWGARVADEIALDLSNLKIEGNFTARRLTVRGKIYARNLNARGDASLRGIEATEGDFSGMRVGGRLAIRGLVEPGVPRQLSRETGGAPVYTEGASITATTIAGNLHFRDARIDGSVLVGALAVGGRLAFDNARIGGRFKAFPDAAQSGGDGTYAAMVGLVVREDVVFNGAEVSGRLRLRGVTIGQSFRFIAGSANEIEIAPFYVGDEAYAKGRREIPSRVGKVTIRVVHVAGHISLPFIQVTGVVSWENRRGVAIENCEIGGNVRLWLPSVARPSHYDPLTDGRTRRACISGDLSVLACTIGGEVTLTNVLVDGVIRLMDSTISGDVAIRSHVSLIRDTGTVEWLRDQLFRELDEGGATKPIFAEARALDMTMVTSHNDIDLTGLKLKKPTEKDKKLGTPRYLRVLAEKWPLLKHLPGDMRTARWFDRHVIMRAYVTARALFTSRPRDFAAYKPSCGWVEARGLSVKGNLQLYTDNRRERATGAGKRMEPERDSAEIPSFANFRDLTATRVILTSRDCFGRNRLWPQDGCRVGLILDSAKIGELDIAADATQKPNWFRRRVWDYGGRQPYPTPINLQDTSLESWRIGDGEEDGDADKAAEIMDLLDGDPIFRHSIYSSAEQTLRNRGHDDQADQLLRRAKIDAYRQRLFDFIKYCGRVFSANEGSRGVAYWPVAFVGALFGHFIYLINRHLIGFGTQIGRLLMVIAISLLCSLPVYVDRDNFVLSVDAAAADNGAFTPQTPQRKVDASPPADEWEPLDGLAVGAEKHVPLLQLSARDEWRLNDEPGVDWNWGVAFEFLCMGWVSADDIAKDWDIETTYKIEEISPEDWGLAAIILNFIMWPLVVAFVAKRIFND